MLHKPSSATVRLTDNSFFVCSNYCVRNHCGLQVFGGAPQLSSPDASPGLKVSDVLRPDLSLRCHPLAEHGDAFVEFMLRDAPLLQVLLKVTSLNLVVDVDDGIGPTDSKNVVVLFESVSDVHHL